MDSQSKREQTCIASNAPDERTAGSSGRVVGADRLLLQSAGISSGIVSSIWAGARAWRGSWASWLARLVRSLESIDQ
jgi:hypothetical protein